MNSVSIVGRLTREPDVRYTGGENPMAIARFTVAVDRRIKKENEATADFISCVAFGKTAEFIERYFFKGNRIGINGRIQTGSYQNNDGKTVYTTDVYVENCEFVESKNQSSSQTTKSDSFMNVPDQIDDELPFE